jgi:hypothetical protein
MSIYRYGDTEESPSGDSEVTLTVHYTDTSKSDFVAEFYQLTTSTYLCMTNSGVPYTVKESDVQYMLTQVEKYLNGDGVVVNN